MDVIDVVTWNPKTSELTVEKPLTKEQEEAVVNWVRTDKAKEEVRAAINKRAGRATGVIRAMSSPAENGVTFAVPVLSIQHGDLFHQLEEDDIIERNNWTLTKSDADLSGFVITMEQRGISIDIEKNATTNSERIQTRFLADTDHQQRLLEVSAAWPVAKLVVAISRAFRIQD